MAAVVALDLGRQAIRGAQIETPYTARPAISRFASVPVPEGTIVDGEIIDRDRAGKAIKQLWKMGGFTTRRVTLSLGNRKVVVREVTLPTAAVQRGRTSLRFAVEGQVPIDLDDAILDFLPLRDVVVGGEHRQEGLLVATVRSSLESTVTALEGAGRMIDSIDFAGFSLLRALPDPHPGTQAIVNIGASSTTVVIASGGAPGFVRILPSGGDDITRSIERALGVSYAEAEQDKRTRGLQGGATDPRDVDAESVLREQVATLVTSIRNTLNFWTSSHPQSAVEAVVLAGGGSRLQGIHFVMSRALGVEVRYGDPLASFELGRRLRDSELDRWALELAAPLGVTIGAKPKPQATPGKGRAGKSHEKPKHSAKAGGSRIAKPDRKRTAKKEAK